MFYIYQKTNGADEERPSGRPCKHDMTAAATLLNPPNTHNPELPQILTTPLNYYFFADRTLGLLSRVLNVQGRTAQIHYPDI